MIRELTASEIPLTLEGAHAFFAESKMPGSFSDDAYLKTWSVMVSSGRGVLLVDFEGETPIGALGACISSHMFTGDMMTVECFWFVFPQYRGRGIKLVKAYEEWSKQKGAKFICMVHLKGLQPEILKSLYERMGYHEIETNYLKEAA